MSETYWHKCSSPLIPRRTVEGGWTLGDGQVWRRRNKDGKWEYKQSEETEEEFLNRQV